MKAFAILQRARLVGCRNVANKISEGLTIGTAIRLRSKRILCRFLFIILVYITIQFVIVASKRDTKFMGFRSMLRRALYTVEHRIMARPNFGQQVCRHPDLEVEDPYVNAVPRIDCGDEIDWVRVNGSTMYITYEAREKYGDIQCNFKDVIRTNEHENELGVTKQSSTGYNLVRSDFVKVQCKGSRGKRWQSVLAGIRHNQDLVENLGWARAHINSLHLNVLMWGFDSLSRNVVATKLPKTHRFLRYSLQAIELEGYNIVGDGMHQTLLPILTGRTEPELPETRKTMGDESSYVDVYPFIWKEFQDHGYVTGFLEDSPHIGTFSDHLKGFNAPPTHHYMRPFYLTAEAEYSSHNKYCLAAIPRHKVMMNYIHEFFKVYKDKPKFLFGFNSELSQGYNNMIGAADQDVLEWLTTLYREGHLNKTLLIMMSDHGHRFADISNTQQHKQGERLPMFFLVFPCWFQRLHPKLIKNLRLNSERLTSPFDIHATLRNVLHFQGAGKGYIADRSISLFQQVPLERTCMHAHIEPHWCTCLDWLEVSIKDSLVKRAAEALVNSINKYTEKLQYLCPSLALDRVHLATKLIPTEGLLRFHHNADREDGFLPDTPVSHEVYQLKITTQPGGATFETSLSYNVKEDDFTIQISDVKRIYKYWSQNGCIVNTEAETGKFCDCMQDGTTFVVPSAGDKQNQQPNV